MEPQKTPSSQKNLKNKVGLMLSDVKLFYKAIIIKTICGTGIKHTPMASPGEPRNKSLVLQSINLEQRRHNTQSGYRQSL